MNKILKSNKGITFVTLAVAIVILVIVTNVLVYNAKDSVYIKRLTQMYNDLDLLRDKVALYYSKYGEIPKLVEYTDTSKLQVGNVLGANDSNVFYVIDLKALDGITINLGGDYKKVEEYIKSLSGGTISQDTINGFKDLYIINENSHNIFYVEGVEVKGQKMFHTDEEKPDTVKVIKDTEPYLPDNSGARYLEKTNLQNGLVAIDKNENEWVWVEVPKSKVFLTAKNETDYANIKIDLVTYASVYRQSGYDDMYQTGIGFKDETEYTNQYNRTLSSVYKYGGFWIGRYEAGTETQRKAVTDSLTTVVSKQDVYPYNWVTVEQAQGKAKEINPDSSNKVSSLMFGIQWDLTCKYIEEKGKLEDGTKVTQDMIKTDSSLWGNYYNVTFNIIKGKYSTNSGTTFTPVSGIYPKPLKTPIILTTGVSERNKVLNIYDLAGNEWEWTIEKSSNVSYPCSDRGGRYNDNGLNYPAVSRDNFAVSNSDYNIAFRPTLIL